MRGLPKLPEDITVLSDPELMSLFSNIQSWVDYSASRLAIAEIDEKQLDQEISVLTALNAIQHKSEKTVALAKARLHENDEYNNLTDLSQKAYANRKLIESLHKSAEGRSALVSRELSRRIARNDREKRVS